MADPLILPNSIPVMPLPGAVLFPHALLPLYIFEGRYRAMLKYALDQHRMFCVTLIREKNGEWNSSRDFNQVATAGLIRACVGRSDGTSNLILQGLKRVRFKSYSQEHPFPIAEIETLDSNLDGTLETDALGTKVLALYQKFKNSGRQFPAKVDQYLADLSDPEMLADLMAATFISDPTRRQQLLQELSINQRLRLVIRYLSEETGNAAA